ncbi:WGR domain-containing protein [Bradyrhizobium iriomotense]|uniref:WGR domain-containing protein n=2 Tax=Bradyrhizobium iriomotense TaxID=441950 RepID=A0ABQ6B2I4_9BRAD|nr:WGR domain-containing protein [Bradyrhizobium iriomotense]
MDLVSAASENLGMPNFNSAPLHLRRIDATRNMRRFYLLSIEPTLFGGVSLIRNWGRIGTNGQTMVQTFDGSDEAGDAFGRLERAKRKRGYGAVEEKV